MPASTYFRLVVSPLFLARAGAHTIKGTIKHTAVVTVMVVTDMVSHSLQVLEMGMRKQLEQYTAQIRADK